MVDAEFTNIETYEDDEYGMKIAFDVEGESAVLTSNNIQNRIDDWDKTHHRKIRDRNGKSDRWEIDLDFGAIETVEEATGVNFPTDEIVPEDETVAFTIEEGSMFIDIHPDTSEVVINRLQSELSYEVEWYDQNAHKHRTYDKDLIYEEGDQKRIPIGLKEKTKEILDDMGIHYNFIDHRQEPDWFQVNYEWNFPHELRDYQRDGISRCLKGSCVVQWPTGAGKTVTALRIVKEMGLRTLVIVDSIDLKDQWVEAVRNILGKEPGVLQGDNERRGDVTIATIQTLKNRIEDYEENHDVRYQIDEFDIFITDECHHLPADSWFEIALRVDAYYRYGLSATAEQGLRNDNLGLKIIAGIGPNDIVLDPADLIDQGYLAEPEFEWLYPPEVDAEHVVDHLRTPYPEDEMPNKKGFSGWQEEYRWAIVRNDADVLRPDPDWKGRNDMIAEKAVETFEDDRRVLIDVDYIEHGELLRDKFEEGLVRSWEEVDMPMVEESDFPYEAVGEDVAVVRDRSGTLLGWHMNDMRRALENAIEECDDPVVWLSGKDGGEFRSWVLDKFRNGDISCLVSTLLREGVDVPELDTVILAGGGKSPISVIQTIGRALRPESDDALIVDMWDAGEYVREHSSRRVEIMENYYTKYFDSRPANV